ncbi:23S rRNA (guanosine(2251)-2'-O)-methyltransferase RlmB [Pontibacter sp. G13]|uniref:23S rRNA (guanosine(2251)-2'-O)-methyltransferase RlmB n=1 Tax=Pontibacter sp. G13 TaxID=3074898 RepID=UPI0028894AB9|nr:23S rRNA (guanosine(2251)-2'-O)-methyltransferase RlmB [Pontibacter sp. G13]WNJ21481.1 23S rRNA (guanosine(2251)-2'-O)-methyltransferase RlmB [Pontibacter sp. G13]
MSEKQASEKSDKRIIFGMHPIVEALENGKPLEKIMLKKGVSPDRVADVRKLAAKAEIPIQYVPDEKLYKLSKTDRHQGAVAFISAIEYQPLEETLIAIQDQDETPLVVMLDGVTDVRNFGAIARSAECLGAHAIIVPRTGAAPANGVALKTSAGALHHIPVCRVNHLVDAIMMLQSYGIKTIACSEKSEKTIYQTDFIEPTCLIMGSEEKGVSGSILKRVDGRCSIPMMGAISSLNVSVAAGIILSEVARQRFNQ